MRATLGEVLTDGAFDGMIAVATRFTAGARPVLDPPRSAVDHHPARRALSTGSVPSRAPAASPEPPPIPDATSTCTYMINRGIFDVPGHP